MPVRVGRWQQVGWVCGVVVAMSGVRASACSTPVFRYALMNWVPDVYRMVVFHRGPLGKTDRALVDRLVSWEPPRANVHVQVVDLSGKPEASMQALWRAQKTDTLPWLVLGYPESTATSASVWSGPLTGPNAGAVLDSPKRHEIARRLTDGECAVWVLLESGDAARDAAAAKTLDTQLKRMATVLKLPEPMADGIDAPADDAPGDDGPADPGPVSFAQVRLSRTDPAERILVAMLLGSEPDLKGLSDPMAFPVFGRGRVLYALVGQGINGENIHETCAQLVGACSCEVKAAHPGMDLLMAVNWDTAITTEWAGQSSLPALRGLSEFVAMPTDADRATATQPAPTTAPSRPTPQAVAPPAAPGGSLLRNLLVVLAVLVVGVVAVGVVLRVGRKETRG